jgi:hypothetical protein
MSERLDGKKQLEEMLNRLIKDWSKDPLQDEYDHVDSEFGPFTSDTPSIDFATYATYLEMSSMQHQIDELTQKLAEASNEILNLRHEYNGARAAFEGMCKSVKQNSLSSLTHTISERVKTPMTCQQLADYVSSNEYSAELALQHALLLLEKQSEDIIEARREAIRWQDAWVENSTLEDVKTTLFPWNKYWNKGEINLSNCLHCGEFREHGHKCKI